MKKGFTLIELLAVIVILAIIALIATPIILGIINDAREKSNERSVELYASAVKNAIASYQLTHPNAPTTFEDLDVEYDGNVVCAKEELYADGSFYIADCTVNGDAVEYTYGKQQESPYVQVYKPQYYGWLVGYLGDHSIPSNPSTVPTGGSNYYFGYDITNDIVSDAYICFVRNEIEYCLKGTTDGSSYATNVDIIKDAYSDVVDTEMCSFSESISYCIVSNELNVSATSNGRVDVSINDENGYYIDSDGYFEYF